MRKIILLLFTCSIAFSGCKKEDNKVKQTRLKTYTFNYYTRTPASLDKYTIVYNNASKIDKVLYEHNGSLYSTKYCVYTAAGLLDSIVERYAGGGMDGYKVSWSGGTISKIRGTSYTYKSNGLIDKKIYDDGTYFRNEYREDSLFQYYGNGLPTESLSSSYTLSSVIKNPFLIPGFERESVATGVLFYYNNVMNALYPFIETKEVDGKDYTFEGSFNDYPLKRSDLTNSTTANRSIETFTYEEF